MTNSISELTSREVAERIASNPVAVIPFGSIEQHGTRHGQEDRDAIDCIIASVSI